jgi:hypothetical protein
MSMRSLFGVFCDDPLKERGFVIPRYEKNPVTSDVPVVFYRCFFAQSYRDCSYFDSGAFLPLSGECLILSGTDPFPALAL